MATDARLPLPRLCEPGRLPGDREIAPGLRGAPSDPRLVRRWLEAVRGWAQFMEKVDHLKRRR